MCSILFDYRTKSNLIIRFSSIEFDENFVRFCSMTYAGKLKCRKWAMEEFFCFTHSF